MLNPRLHNAFLHSIDYLRVHRTAYGHKDSIGYQKLKWDYDPKLWEAFEEGKTGIPLVDAAICQLKTTGYMHNRCRMVVANVLTKFFHIDWRHGEKFFAKWLTDYDPSNNNGGWQWAAGTGADAQPYYRIFNPYTQAKKSDPQCVYIKKWLPHFKEKTPQEIFRLVSPFFNYEKERLEAIDRFRSASE
jgi:deoxyribodipyrimidine photo-lyase